MTFPGETALLIPNYFQKWQEKAGSGVWLGFHDFCWWSWHMMGGGSSLCGPGLAWCKFPTSVNKESRSIPRRRLQVEEVRPESLHPVKLQKT